MHVASLLAAAKTRAIVNVDVLKDEEGCVVRGEDVGRVHWVHRHSPSASLIVCCIVGREGLGGEAVAVAVGRGSYSGAGAAAHSLHLHEGSCCCCSGESKPLKARKFQRSIASRFCGPDG